MDIKISPGRLEGSLEAISSKSDMHRALICAALSDRETEIFCNVLSKDIEATADCLRALGAEIAHDEEKGSFKLRPVDLEKTGKIQEKAELFCGESGSTLRFIMPVAAALGGSFLLTGKGKLPERPMGPLLRELKSHGISLSSEKLPIVMEGKLSGKDFEMEGDISSQFITGLLLAFPLLDGEVRLKLSSRLESSGYVDITLSVMRAFGREVEREGDSFYLKPSGKPGYISPLSYRVEGDWSNSALWLCADFLSGNSIAVTGLLQGSLQGDRAVTEVLSSLEREGDVTVDASQIPDLVPALSVCAAMRRGRTLFVNAGRLRIKECDRLSAIAENLERLRVSVIESADSLEIEGRESIEGGVRLPSYNDHRIAMSAAILATACSKPVVIEGAEAVNKSYPGFFDDFRRLGGKADVI